MFALFKSGKDGVEVIRVTFNYWGEVDLFALLCVIYQEFQLKCWKQRFWVLIIHPVAQSVSPGVRSSWLLARELEFRDAEKHDGAYSCIFPVCTWRKLHFCTSQDLSFVECLQLHYGEIRC